MITKIKDLIKKVIIKLWLFRCNDFYRDLFDEINKYDTEIRIVYVIMRSSREHAGEISRYLYEKLDDNDRNVLLRFYLKRFFSVDTITESEKIVIDKAFEDVKKSFTENDRFVFFFRGRKLSYYSPAGNYSGTYIERRLVDYYEVAHSFFLVEYELEGFNPLREGTILDCGASNGDTAMLFSCLYPNTRIISFEYEKEKINNLQNNLADNEITNVIPVHAFLYADSGSHFIDEESSIDSEGARISGQKITTLAIDDYISDHSINDVTLIKFDIEGGEQMALKGAVETIMRQKPILYIPIYHLKDDIYRIPEFLHDLDLPMSFSIKWTEKLVWGMDCVLFVRFE